MPSSLLNGEDFVRATEITKQPAAVWTAKLWRFSQLVLIHDSLDFRRLFDKVFVNLV